MKKMITAMLAAAVFTLTACSDDEKASPNNQFDFVGDAVSLKGANLYLVDNADVATGHVYYDYTITNGTYEGGSTWSMGSYEGADYLLVLRVAVPGETETLSAGNYPVYYSFDDAAETSNIAWIVFDSPNANYFPADDALGTDVLKLSGGFGNGETLTVRYSGSLEYDNDESGDNVTGKFYFTGKVQDIRP